MRPHAVVVGAGPVGALSALLLARNNISVTLIEQNTSLLSVSRASTFHPSTLDLLGSINIFLHAAPDAVMVDSIQWRDNGGGLRAEFKYDLIRDASKHPFRVHVEQQSLLNLLSELISVESEIETCFGTTVVGLNPERLSVTTLSVEGRRKTIHTDMVVGCDGAKSTIRRLAGIAFRAEDYPTFAIRASVRGDLTAHLPESAPKPLSGLCYFRDGDDGASLLQMRHESRLIVRATKAQSEPERLAEALSNATPWRFNALSIGKIETYRLRRGVVDNYLSEQGNVVVLGDAAHQTSTAGGLNMNSGIHDAFAMVPVLAELMRGRSAARPALEKIGKIRRDYLLNEVIPRSERRVQGLQEPGKRSVKENLMDLERIAEDNARVRQFLIESSLLDSPLTVK